MLSRVIAALKCLPRFHHQNVFRIAALYRPGRLPHVAHRHVQSAAGVPIGACCGRPVRAPRARSRARASARAAHQSHAPLGLLHPPGGPGILRQSTEQGGRQADRRPEGGALLELRVARATTGFMQTSSTPPRTRDPLTPICCALLICGLGGAAPWAGCTCGNHLWRLMMSPISDTYHPP